MSFTAKFTNQAKSLRRSTRDANLLENSTEPNYLVTFAVNFIDLNCSCTDTLTPEPRTQLTASGLA